MAKTKVELEKVVKKMAEQLKLTVTAKAIKTQIERKA